MEHLTPEPPHRCLLVDAEVLCAFAYLTRCTMSGVTWGLPACCFSTALTLRLNLLIKVLITYPVLSSSRNLRVKYVCTCSYAISYRLGYTAVVRSSVVTLLRVTCKNIFPLVISLIITRMYNHLIITVYNYCDFVTFKIISFPILYQTVNKSIVQ